VRHLRCVFHQVRALLFVLCACAFTAHVLAHMQQCVNDAALLRDGCAGDQSECLSSLSTAIASNALQAVFWRTAVFPEPLNQLLLLLMIPTLRDLPIQDLPSAIGPEAKGHQDHLCLAGALVALPRARVGCDLLVCVVDRDPHPIPLENRRHLRDRCGLHSPGERLHVLDPFVEDPQPHTSLHAGALTLLQLPHALPTTAAEPHMLIEIHPIPVRRFNMSDVAHHSMMALVAFEYGETQVAEWPPASRTVSAILSIADAWLSVGASILPTVPTNGTPLSTDPTCFPFSHPSLALTSASRTAFTA